MSQQKTFATTKPPAVGPVGIHHGHRLGQGVLALVVVSDHQLHAQLPAQPGFLHGGDAAVHGDDEFYSFLMQLAQGDGVEAVALFQTAGDVADAVRAVAAQEIRQKTGGGDAVHVIVAKNGDFFLILDGQRHPSGGEGHVRHEKGSRRAERHGS